MIYTHGDIMERTELGKESRLWRNLTLMMPYEVVERLGAKPGDNVQFFENDGQIIIKKVN
jgi:bifunctional DNA-binding transcriptional regulator/antitoxin component of YhaV-PrlF toxin-antitoxin module